jgi:hypothetical protein
MKFLKGYNLNYYLDFLVSYNLSMKGLRVSNKLISSGKSYLTLKIGKTEEEHIKVVKGLSLFYFFFKEGNFLVDQTFLKKGLIKLVFNFKSYISESWIVYFLDFFYTYVRSKGLYVNTFLAKKNWVFFFRQFGELRFGGFKFDYYGWSPMLSIFIKRTDNLNIIFSSLKIKNALFSRERS